MPSTPSNPARHSFSHTSWIVIETPRLEDFIRIPDSGSIQRYVSRAGATIRFRAVTDDDTIADPVDIEVRSGVVVLLQPDADSPGNMILSVLAWAIEDPLEEYAEDSE